MGAGTLLQAIGFAASEKFEIDQDRAKLAMAQARDAIESLDEKRFDDINEEMGGEYDDLAGYRELLRSDVAAVEEALADNRRDATKMTGGPGIVLLVSGGLSWGDAPIELLESMSRLHHAEVMPDVRWPT